MVEMDVCSKPIQTCQNAVGTEASEPCSLLGMHREIRGWCQNLEQNQPRCCRSLPAVSEGLPHVVVDLIYGTCSEVAALLCFPIHGKEMRCLLRNHHCPYLSP